MEELFKSQVEEYTTLFFNDYTEIEYQTFRHFDTVPKSDEHGNIQLVFRERPYNPKKLHFSKKDSSTEHATYVENYGNLLTTVAKRYAMIVVEGDENKVSLKIFSGTRIRARGSSHFRIRKNMTYLTLNKNSGDVYYGKLTNYNLKKKFRKTISKNIFFNGFSQRLLQSVNSLNVDMKDDLIEAINIFTSNFSLPTRDEKTLLNERLIEYYLKKKGIKYPNNYKLFYENYENKLPLTFIRKNGNKLIDAFMKKNELSGSKIKKALHEATSLNIPILNLSIFMFGSDWVNQDEQLITDSLHFKNIGYFYDHPLGENIEELNITVSEKRRMFNIFKNYVLKGKIQLFTFFDHIRFYRELKIHGEKVKWTATSQDTFSSEHVDFSDRVDYYRKGYYKRIYPKYMYEMIQEPLTVNEKTYHPVLLDSTETYNHESLVQSNCVKNYIGSSGSIIVSLRRGTIDSDVRSTIEFRIANKPNEKISFTVPQALGKFNSKLTEEWDFPLEVLKKRFFKCIRDKRFKTVKLSKTFKNGKELSSESSWDETGNLRWDTVDITKYY
jgi:hypothetical protein